jgi:hypothetical protein
MGLEKPMSITAAGWRVLKMLESSVSASLFPDDLDEYSL